jgi:hypothetical protein
MKNSKNDQTQQLLSDHYESPASDHRFTDALRRRLVHACDPSTHISLRSRNMTRTAAVLVLVVGIVGLLSLL